MNGLHNNIYQIFLIAGLFIVSCTSPDKSRVIQVDYEESAMARWHAKEVLASKVVEPMESLDNWKVEGYATASLTEEQSHDGTYAIRMKSPVNANYEGDRPGVGAFGEGRITLYLDREDWTNYNRIAYWVYPHSKGFGPIHVLTKLFNDDESWNQRVDGLAMNFTELEPNRWNQVIWEIEDLKRDQVTAISLIYVMRGKPFHTGPDTLLFDFDKLELQQVEPDYVEGWEVAPGRISYSHTGYLPEASKQAFASDLSAGKFSLQDAENNEVVHEGAIKEVVNELGRYQMMDFSEYTTPGNYILKAGDRVTKSFRIHNHLWEPSIEKVINFFYCERCGMPVEGIHDQCHQEFYFEHEGQKIKLDGGWHDAADLTKKGENPEGVYAMFKLAAHLEKEGRNPELVDKLYDEGIWGLDWLMKVRFEDGTRFQGSAMRWWQNGKAGDFDDVTRYPREGREEFFSGIAAAVEASSARFLKERDPERSKKSADLARKDWAYAVDHLGNNPGISDASVTAWSSIELYALTREQQYADKAAEMGSVITQCQQRQWLEDADHKISGMFTYSTHKNRFYQHGHRGAMHRTSIALRRLCEELPNHPDWITWYAALAIHADYYQKTTARFTRPYRYLPHGIYHIKQEEEGSDKYKLITNGTKLGGGWYLRKMVRALNGGHFGVLLAQSSTLASAASLRGDKPGADLVQNQLQWIIGRNPFSQSCMIGEGYDYPPIYAYSGDFMVGALPVGIKLRPPQDQPYWPTQNTWAYKEVWVHPGYMWLWTLAEAADAPSLQPGTNASGESTPEVDFSSRQEENRVILTAEIKDNKKHTLSLRTHNLELDEGSKKISPADLTYNKFEWTISLIHENEPWVAVLVVDDDVSKRFEAIGPKW